MAAISAIGAGLGITSPLKKRSSSSTLDEAIKKIIYFSKENGYELVGIEDSPIRGTKGNKEFLALIGLRDSLMEEE